MTIQAMLDAARAHAAPFCGEGEVARYIPALAEVDPMKIGLAMVDLKGREYVAGDADEPFSIQSISKVFTLALALESSGEGLWDCVGREPSGSPFNSIVQLETEAGKPRNPLINAGAIVVTDRLIGERSVDETVADLLSTMRKLGRDQHIFIDTRVAASEAESGARNRSLAYFMAAFGNLKNPPERALSAYFQQCSLALTCRQLARSGLFLANGGIDPVTGEQFVSATRCKRINAVMLTCGHYDNSGDFAFRVGLPGKSGVGGGILVVAPGRGTVVAWSPALNKAGTSLVGAAALEHFTRAAGWSVFE